MSVNDLIQEIRRELEAAGKPWRLHFEVSDKSLREGDWVQIFVNSDSDRGNNAAERQILRNVESDIAERFGEEILLVKVSGLESVA